MDSANLLSQRNQRIASYRPGVEPGPLRHAARENEPFPLDLLFQLSCRKGRGHVERVAPQQGIAFVAWQDDHDFTPDEGFQPEERSFTEAYSNRNGIFRKRAADR